MKQKLLVILGPTGCGKTALSLDIAKKFNGEIISADSRQFYRGMDIGTEKITISERVDIPHHLIDIRDPDEIYTVAEFKRDAELLITEIHERGKLPIVVGGTGLYISALIENYHLTPGGKTKGKGPGLYDTLLLQPQYERDTLYNTINDRIDRQIQRGLLDEICVITKQYGWDSPALTGIGYRQFRPCIEGDTPLAVCSEKAKQHSRNYAKRQITWFKRYEGEIVTVRGYNQAEKIIQDWI